MTQPRKALVIGAEGNIGSRLSTYLRAIGYEVLDADIKPRWRPGFVMADINHPLDLLEAFDWGPDVVFLCAALVGRMTSEQAGSLAVTTNLAGINNVLQLCRRAGAMCVNFSTSEVYGPECGMDESSADPRPANRYGLSKWLAEQLVEYEVRRHGLRAVTVRPCMIYDEFETVGEHRSAMIRFASNLARGRPITVHRGTARSWLHALDAAKAFEAAGRVSEYAAINVGHPEVVGMRELAEMMCCELGADRSLMHDAGIPPGITPVKHPVLDRQNRLLGVVPEISIDEGVRRVCAVQRRLVAEEEAIATLGNGDGRRLGDALAGLRGVSSLAGSRPGKPVDARHPHVLHRAEQQARGG